VIAYTQTTLPHKVASRVLTFRSCRHSPLRTLYNLFTKAKYPDRVHAGVVQQNSEGDVGERDGKGRD